MEVGRKSQQHPRAMVDLTYPRLLRDLVLPVCGCLVALADCIKPGVMVVPSRLHPFASGPPERFPVVTRVGNES